MKQDEVNCCQIQEWYPKFKSFSIKTLIHELPESFFQYLVGDSGPFFLPTSVSNEDALPNRIHNPEDEEDFQVAEGSEDESEQPSTPPPSFPELEMKIKESIESHGDRRVKLIDFNPWCAVTLPLLFTWDELEESRRGEEDLDLRVVESQLMVRPGLKTAVPYDYIDMSAGSGWDQFFRRADEELECQMRSSEAGA